MDLCRRPGQRQPALVIIHGMTVMRESRRAKRSRKKQRARNDSSCHIARLIVQFETLDFTRRRANPETLIFDSLYDPRTCIKAPSPMKPTGSRCLPWRRSGRARSNGPAMSDHHFCEADCPLDTPKQKSLVSILLKNYFWPTDSNLTPPHRHDPRPFSVTGRSSIR